MTLGTPSSPACCATMAGEETQTPPRLRTPENSTGDRTAVVVQEHKGGGIFETVNDDSNASSPSDSSSGRSAMAGRALPKPSNDSDFTKRDNDARTVSNAAAAVSTSGKTTVTLTSGGGRAGRRLSSAAIEGGHASEDYGDLSDFVLVTGDKHSHDVNKLPRYDAGIDVPLPRRHLQVARAKAAKSAAGRQLSGLSASKVGNKSPSLCTSTLQALITPIPQVMGPCLLSRLYGMIPYINKAGGARSNQDMGAGVRHG